MARLNIYLPDALAADLNQLRGRMNFSEVCAAALRAELSARMTARSPGMAFNPTARPPWSTAERLCARVRLRDVLAQVESNAGDQRKRVARSTAMLLDRILFEGAQVAVGGGAQVWSTIRRLRPRNLRIALSAVGFGPVDHAAPHLHPNVLVTLLNLAYAPRSTATLVGSPDFMPMWSLADPRAGGIRPEDIRPDIRRVIIGSCAPFDPASAYARVLGGDITDILVDEHVVGDFLGVFLTPDGRAVEPWVPGGNVSHIGSGDLRAHAQRSDTIVALAAAGEHKVTLIRRVLEAELCNTLITNEATASALLA